VRAALEPAVRRGAQVAVARVPAARELVAQAARQGTRVAAEPARAALEPVEQELAEQDLAALEPAEPELVEPELVECPVAAAATRAREPVAWLATAV
jgi:hypothetical protein